MAEQPRNPGPRQIEPGASTKTQGEPVEPFTSAPSAARDESKDPTQELLENLNALRGRVAEFDRVTAQAIATVVQQGADPSRRNEPVFRHQLAFAVQDVEKALRGAVDMPPDLRAEMTARASSAPGLENDRMLALMKSTSSIDDHRVVRDIRAMGFDIGRRDAQDTPSIRTTLDTLENATRLATRVKNSSDPAQRDPSASVTPDQANLAANGPPRAGSTNDATRHAGRQEGPVTANRSPFDVIMSGLRGPSTRGPGAPWDPPATPMAGRFALYEQRMQQGADDRVLQAAEKSGQEALKALEAFRSTEAATVMNRIDAAAKADPGGMAGVLAEMKPGGRFADFRQQFNGALQTDRGVATAYDRAAASLAQYGQDRSAIDSVIGRRPDAVNLAAKFGSLDAQIGDAASATPSRRDGKTMIDDLAQKAAELLQRAVDGALAIFGRANTVETASRPSPSPGP